MSLDTILTFAVFAAVGFAIFALLIAIRYEVKLTTLQAEADGRRSLIDNLAEGVYHSKMDGTQLSANPALVALNGYDTEEELLQGFENKRNEWYVDPNRRDEFLNILKRDGFVKDFVSEVYRHKTRERIWITENTRLVRDPQSGKPLYYEGTVRDITEKVAEDKADALLHNLTEKLPHGLFRLVRHPDRTFSCPYVSKRFREMVNLPDDAEFDAMTFANNVHPEDLLGYEETLKISRDKLVDWRCEFRFCWPNGEYHWCAIQASPELQDNGDMVWHGYLSNIDQRKEDEEKVHQLAYFDQLTGLPNRTHFMEMARKKLEIAKQKGTFCAIGFIDLDNFKQLNDTHGHNFGDRLLQAIAKRLSDTRPKNGFASRFGGDEFVFMLTDLSSSYEEAKERLERSADMLLSEICGDFTIDNIQCTVTMSIGLSLCDPKLDLRMGDLLKSADVAMYEVKKSGRNNAVIHDSDMLERVSAKYKLQRDIQEAINTSQFNIVLQPQLDKNGILKSAEALVRWNHPEHGQIMPSEFIELAEQTGQINKINDWVLQRSIEILLDWRNKPNLKDISLSVNISPRQMLDKHFVSWLEDVFSEHDLPAHRLTLELTEHAMAKDPDTVDLHMRRLQSIGICFSLDDFGTGYSSMARLRQLPFNELKIDGSFVADLGKHDAALELVTAILHVAKALGLTTVAEHVSSQDQLNQLSSLGCDMYQGYLLSRPLPVRDFEAMASKKDTKDCAVVEFKRTA